MAHYYKEESKTFSEYLLLPEYSSEDHVPNNVDLTTTISKFSSDEDVAFRINIPVVSAIMQSVSDNNLAVALAKEGGLSFIYCSQKIEEQCKMVRKVKEYKAGFVTSDSNLSPMSTLEDVINLQRKTGHSTIAITKDGSPIGKLCGLVTSKDYRISRMDLSTKVTEFMTPISELICAKEGTTLKVANDIIWEKRINALPIINDKGCLVSFVFRKDYENHKVNPQELLDKNKRYMVGAGVNTHDYKERIPALIEAGADVLCIDSSEGHTEWQRKTIEFVRSKYGEKVKIGAGNVVDKEGFLFLANAGADFIKVGIGGGAICITRETKGIGRGQASALIEVSNARNEYYKENGVYIPICSDGGIVYDHHITLALAMGADFVMLGRYFARFDESPSKRVWVNGRYMKEYWGEGSFRAQNWARYDNNESTYLKFEEGVDSYVPYAGKLRDNIRLTMSKVKATMCNCGSLTIRELQDKARIIRISRGSMVESGAHDVVLKTGDLNLG